MLSSNRKCRLPAGCAAACGHDPRTRREGHHHRVLRPLHRLARRTRGTRPLLLGQGPPQRGGSNAAPARGKDRSQERIKITCQQTAAFAIIGAHTAVVKLADAPDLGSGAARRSGSSPLGGTTSGHGARCKGMSKAHPFRFYAGPSSFPKNLRCANLFWEPYSFTYKANLVSPWAFAQGLYSIACSLAQSILRSVTELPAQWAIPKFGRMPKPHRGCRQNIRPHPFSPKSFAVQNICGSPFYF